MLGLQRVPLSSIAALPMNSPALSEEGKAMPSQRLPPKSPATPEPESKSALVNGVSAGLDNKVVNDKGKYKAREDAVEDATRALELSPVGDSGPKENGLEKAPGQEKARGQDKARRDAEDPKRRLEKPPDGGTGLNGTLLNEKPPGPSEILPSPLIDGLDHKSFEQGVLIPLKTVLEARQDHTVLQAYITRSPTQCASEVMDLLRSLLPAGSVKSLPHLRRCAKPCDLPAHLKTQFMNDTPTGRTVHTGKSTWIYIIIGDVRDVSKKKVVDELAKIGGIDEPFMEQIPVPANPPTSQINAAMWSSQFWPTLYRKNNPLGPHPSQVARSTDEIRHDASLWMTIAHQAAKSAAKAGIGEAMGACIVQREDGKAQLLAVAGDARWHQELASTTHGNPMAHSTLRAISMVAQKLVRHERRAANQPTNRPTLIYDPFQDAPLLDEEKVIYDEEHPNPDGYLCHGLELYLTHEPCVQCSMGILHSRMGKVIFAHRQTLTGGLCSEDRGHGHPELSDRATGEGLGLFWRRELNWSLMAWEWEPTDHLEALPPIPATMHP